MAAISVAFTWPLWAHLDHWGIQDWDYNYFKQGVAVRSVQHYEQLPLWNPWYYGGFPLLAEPESAVLSPAFLLHLGFGEVAGAKLEVILYYFIGLCGAYVLARHHQLSRAAALTAAVIYMLSGMFALSAGSGMTIFMTGAYIPWAFWAYLRSLERIEFAFLTGGALALMFLGGGATFTPLTAAGLGLLGIAQIAFGQASWRRVVAALAIAGASTGAFTAVKLLPALELMRTYPKTTPAEGGFSVLSFMQALVERGQDPTTPFRYFSETAFWEGNTWGAQERGMYIGVAGLALVVAGIVLRVRARASRRTSLALLAAMTLMVWLSFGYRAPLSLWGAAHHLPVFESMRVPERFRFVFFVILALFAAYAVDAVRAWAARRWGPRVALAVGLAIPAGLFADFLIVDAPPLAHGASVAPLSVEHHPTFRHTPGLPLYNASGWIDERFSRRLHEGIGPEEPGWHRVFDLSWYSLYPALRANLGTLRSDAGWPMTPPVVKAPTSPGYRGELYLESGEGRVQYRAWSPNRLVFRARLAQPGRVIVNQTFDRGWRSDTGRVASVEGLLGVELAAGDHEVVLTYFPRGLALGFAITLASLAVAISLALYLRARRR